MDSEQRRPLTDEIVGAMLAWKPVPFVATVDIDQLIELLLVAYEHECKQLHMRVVEDAWHVTVEW